MPSLSIKTAKSYISLWPALLFFLLLIVAAFAFGLLFTWPQTINGLGILLVKGEIGQVVSPINATVERWLLEESDEVKVGQEALLLRPNDEPNKLVSIKAQSSGHIAEILAYPGTHVRIGDGLALLTAQGDKRKDLELIGFVSSLSGKKVKAGMKALVWPSVTSAQSEGAIVAVVKRVGKLPTAKAALKSLVKIPELAKYIRNRIEDEPFLVVLTLLPDDTQISGYAWQGKGPLFELDYGIVADFSITYSTTSLLTRLWPSLHKLLEKPQ